MEEEGTSQQKSMLLQKNGRIFLSQKSFGFEVTKLIRIEGLVLEIIEKMKKNYFMFYVIFKKNDTFVLAFNESIHVFEFRCCESLKR